MVLLNQMAGITSEVGNVYRYILLDNSTVDMATLNESLAYVVTSIYTQQMPYQLVPRVSNLETAPLLQYFGTIQNERARASCSFGCLRGLAHEV